MKPDLQLSSQTLDKLKKMYKYDGNSRVRTRSHAILLYHQGLSYTQIANVLLEHKDSTISLWVNNFASIGFDSLYDRPRGLHSKASFTEGDKKTLRLAGKGKATACRHLDLCEGESWEKHSGFHNAQVAQEVGI